MKVGVGEMRDVAVLKEVSMLSDVSRQMRSARSILSPRARNYREYSSMSKQFGIRSDLSWHCASLTESYWWEMANPSVRTEEGASNQPSPNWDKKELFPH